MPGGSEEAWPHIKDIMQAIACVDHNPLWLAAANPYKCQERWGAMLSMGNHLDDVISNSC